MAAVWADWYLYLGFQLSIWSYFTHLFNLKAYYIFKVIAKDKGRFNFFVIISKIISQNRW